MGLEVNLDHNFHDLKDLMEQVSNVDILNGTKRAMNSALRRGRVVTIKEMRKLVNLPSTKLKARIRIHKASGTSLSHLDGALGFSEQSVPMINFVIGKKSAIKQKGIKVSRRRKLKVKIKPGQTIRLKGAFIQKVKSKQVFRRTGQGNRLRKLGTKSIAKIAFQKNMKPKIEHIILTRFDREWRRQLDFRFSKTAAKYSRSPMRIPR